MADKLDVAAQQIGEYAERTTDDLIYWHDRALRAEAKVKTLREALRPLFSRDARELLADTAEAERECGSKIVAGAITIALEKDAKGRAALKGGDDED